MSQCQDTGSLRRVLMLGPLIVYGLGVIFGAGIYIAIGAVSIARARPLRFRFCSRVQLQA